MTSRPQFWARAGERISSFFISSSFFPLPLAHLVFGFAFFPAHCVALRTYVSFCPTMFFYFDSLIEKEGPTRPDFDFRISIKSNNEVFSSLTYEIHEL